MNGMDSMMKSPMMKGKKKKVPSPFMKMVASGKVKPKGLSPSTSGMMKKKSTMMDM